MINKSNTGKSLLLAVALGLCIDPSFADSNELSSGKYEVPFIVIDEKTGEEIDITSIPFWNDLTREKEGILHSRTNIPKSIDDKVQELIVDLTTQRGNIVALNDAFSRATQYQNYVEQAYTITGIKRNTILALIATESNGKLRRNSEAGARGAMQLMPVTARYMGLRVDSFIDERMHPKSIVNATNYFKDLVDKYDGNELLALAAYNHGLTNLDDSIEQYGKDIESLWSKLPTETQKFIVRVLARRAILDDTTKYGIEINPQPLFSEKVRKSITHIVEPRESLYRIARLYGFDPKKNKELNKIKELNPEIADYNLIRPGDELKIPGKS